MSKGYRFLSIVKFSIRGVLLIMGLIVIVIPRITFADGPDTMWTKIFGGSESDYGYSVQQTYDGGYILIGYTESWNGSDYDDDVWLIKTDANGDTMWTKTFGGSDYDQGYSVQQTSDEGYIITGYTESYGAGKSDVWLIKTDAKGDTMWTKTFEGGNWDAGYSVQQTSDGGYIIAGYTESYSAAGYDVYLIKTDESGNKQWSRIFGGSNEDGGRSVQETSDKGYIITGVTSSYGAGNSDVWLIKVAPYKGIAESDVIPAKPSFKSIQSNSVNNTYQIFYEIPVSSYVNLRVYNISGRLIKTLFSGKKHAGTYRIDWDTRELPSSIYFLRLETEKQSITERVVVVK